MTTRAYSSATRRREVTLKVTTALLVIVGLALAGALIWDGIQAKASKKATLGNRAIAVTNMWLSCKNYQQLHPTAPVEVACQNLPAHPPLPPAPPQAGGTD